MAHADASDDDSETSDSRSTSSSKSEKQNSTKHHRKKHHKHSKEESSESSTTDSGSDSGSSRKHHHHRRRKGGAADSDSESEEEEAGLSGQSKCLIAAGVVFFVALFASITWYIVSHSDFSKASQGSGQALGSSSSAGANASSSSSGTVTGSKTTVHTTEHNPKLSSSSSEASEKPTATGKSASSTESLKTGQNSSSKESSSSSTKTSTTAKSTSIGSGSSSSASGPPWFTIYLDAGASLPDPSSISGFNGFYCSFWRMSGPVDACNMLNQMSTSDRSALKQKYKAASVAFMVSAFGYGDTPTTSNQDPKAVADKLAQFVKDMDLDGVDVDYEDMDAVAAGKSEDWLITLTKELRAKLPKPYIISHAPLAPWFSTATSISPGGGYMKIHKSVGSLIDFYNVQLYNQDGTVGGSKVNEYEDCTSLLEKSQVVVGTSLYEIAAAGVDKNKLVIGKPGSTKDATNGGYMQPDALAKCVAQAKKDKSWNGGLMIWQYPNQPDGFVKTVWGS
ncbi:glycoside hydrolase [Meredithblackwellia eburnea MCA 4105]